MEIPDRISDCTKCRDEFQSSTRFRFRFPEALLAWHDNDHKEQSIARFASGLQLDDEDEDA